MIRILMSRIVIIFIALFCCADFMMADSFFIESGIKYKVIDNEHVNVADLEPLAEIYEQILVGLLA